MLAARLIDTALDRSIVLGYGNVGLELRRRLPGWPADPPRMDGKVVLITGAASGLGEAAAVGFARLGATVHAHARSAPRAADAVAAISAQAPGAEIVPESCDVASLGALRAFALAFRRRVARLDVLVNNAGVMPDERRRSADGHELMFATHVLAPFALTSLLRARLVAGRPSRVINISSGGMYGQRLPAADLESDTADYGPSTLYARTKREQVIITEQWAQRLEGTGVVVHAMHPGWADTTGVQTAMPGFRTATRLILRSGEQGADTIVWLGAAPEPLQSTGRFWHDRRPRPTHYALGAGSDSEADRAALWDYCESAIAAALERSAAARRRSRSR